MSETLWRRLRYMLTPQFDIYESIAKQVEFCGVLDIGCGTGFGALQLTRQHNLVTGIDIDQDAVKFAAKCLPHVRFEWGDIERGVSYIPAGKKYSVVLMIEVLEHVSDWEKALHNVVEVMEPHGTLYISARNANADLRKNDLHEREWTSEEFMDALYKFFGDVRLYDYTLTIEQDTSTRVTPLVAIAKQPKEV